MRYRRLGRTELRVSQLSLGTGGPNRLGQSRYLSRRGIDRLLRGALDLGVNLFDTSGAYEDSESLLATALRGIPRERYYLSSKVFPWRKERLLDPSEVRGLVERSLRHLRSDTLDLLLLHRVTPRDYAEARDRVLPELERLRAQGKFRFLGISESSTRDPQHRMLQQALEDDLFDTIMVTYHPGFEAAEQTVLPRALERDVGVIGMAAVRHLVPRNAAARSEVLLRTLASLFTAPPRNRDRLFARVRAAYDDAFRPAAQPLPSVVLGKTRTALPMPEAVYTFVASHPAVASVLTGTTNQRHLERNVAAVSAPALSEEEASELRSILS